MTATYCTDTNIEQRDTLARTALAAFSESEVASSRAAATTYDIFRVEASRRILLDLRARGITSGMVTRSSDLQTPEECLALALLFGAVAQWDGSASQSDVYAARAKTWREAYAEEIAKAAPVDGVKSAGASFSWSRG